MNQKKKMLLLFLLTSAIAVSGCMHYQNGQAEGEDTINISGSDISFTDIGATDRDNEINSSMKFTIRGHNVTDVGINTRSGLSSDIKYDSQPNNVTKVVVDLYFSEEMFSNFDSTIQYDQSIVHIPEFAILVQTEDGRDKLTPEDELARKNMNTQGDYHDTTFLEDRVFFSTSDIEYSEYGGNEITTNIYTNMPTQSHTHTVQRIEKQIDIVDDSLDISSEEMNERYIYVSDWKLKIGPSSWLPGFATDRTSEYDQFIYAKGDNIGTYVLPHELIHTYQPYVVTERTDWIIEGFANYLGAIYQAQGSPTEISTVVQEMIDGDGVDGKLADPDTWEGGTDYVNGTRLLHEVDREIQENSDKTIITLFDRLTKYDRMSVAELQYEIQKLTSERFAQKVIDKTEKSSIDVEFDFSSLSYPKD